MTDCKARGFAVADGNEQDQLADYLDCLERDSRFQVMRVLKKSPSQTTELVTCPAKDAPYPNPVVRKIMAGTGIDGAYSLYRDFAQAHKQGKLFQYLPSIYECYETGDKTVVLMQYVEGVTLRDYVAQTSPELRLKTALEVFSSLVPAVSEFHSALGPERLVVHRDLTPSNVICPTVGPTNVRLIDFGIARVWHADADRDTHCFGTRPYAPPEQFGFGQTDVRTDVYALGLMLFYCLTGRDAVQADRDISYRDPAIPEPLRFIIAKAAQLDPQRRYADEAEFAEALDIAIEEIDLAEVELAAIRPSSFPSRLTRSAFEDDAVAACPNSSGNPSSQVAAEGGPSSSHPAFADNLPFGHPFPPSARPAKPLDLVPPAMGRLWNAVLFIIAAFFIAVSYYGLFNPSAGLIPDDPPLQRAYSLGVFMPVLFATLCYALLDRRRLWPRLFRRQPGPLWKKLLISLAIIIIGNLGFVLVYLPSM